MTEFEKALVTAALPRWEIQEGDIVSHGMSWEGGGGCDTCGYGDPGMELWVSVQRAYCPDFLTTDPELRDSMTFYNSGVADIWEAVMNS
jgi:hypothetical protein